MPSQRLQPFRQLFANYNADKVFYKINSVFAFRFTFIARSFEIPASDRLSTCMFRSKRVKVSRVFLDRWLVFKPGSRFELLWILVIAEIRVNGGAYFVVISLLVIAKTMWNVTRDTG